jgi:branched-chain amino acid transport system ATP-binding protein
MNQTHGNDLLKVTGISVQFGGIQALSNVDFTVRRGELVALIGPNGAGKSTMMAAIAGMVKPTHGKVVFRDIDITDVPPHRISTMGIARTFQAAELVRTLTVRENVVSGSAATCGLGWCAALAGWPSSKRTQRRLESQADEWLSLVGLSKQADSPAGTLPAGQQRLLAIARALATQAELLILDEPGAGLNEVEKRHLGQVIRAIWQMGKTVVFIEHDMALVAELAQRLLVLDRGCLIADGAPDEVRRDPAVIAAYLGVSPAPRAATPRAALTVAAQTAPSQAPCAPLLQVQAMSLHYDGAQALDSVTLDVNQGELVALVGANGAGKSSLLKAIARIVPARGGLRFDGRDLAALTPESTVNAGIGLVPEGRELFATMTVLDNLLVGRFPRLRSRGWWHAATHGRPGDPAIAQRLDEIYAMFPVLKERSTQLAGTLSGGQAQMLAIGRALMAEPSLLMLDEPSLGIAPQIVADIMATLQQLRESGMTILLVEQNARAALEIADRGYVLSAGRIVASGPSQTLLADPDILQAYLGGASDVHPVPDAPAAQPSLLRAYA